MTHLYLNAPKKTYRTHKTQADHYYDAVRKSTEKDLAMMDLLYGINAITDDELRALIKKRPHVYGRYAGYLGKRG